MEWLNLRVFPCILVLHVPGDTGSATRFLALSRGERVIYQLESGVAAR